MLNSMADSNHYLYYIPVYWNTQPEIQGTEHCGTNILAYYDINHHIPNNCVPIFFILGIRQREKATRQTLLTLEWIFGELFAAECKNRNMTE